MTSKNRVKTYVSGGYYHIYNRGVAKQDIFLDKQDYRVYLNYLKQALTQPNIIKVKKYVQGRSFNAVTRLPKNFQKNIFLIAYCLMPNHFHLLIKQNDINAMESFMRSIATRYASYFNKKNDRVGPVFQGRYKAIMITDDKYLLHLSRYIHLNPYEITNNLLDSYSSYADYLSRKSTSWVKPEIVLKFFKQKTIPEINKFNNYRDFVENSKVGSAVFPDELALD